jgi:hypothetical protein
VAQQLKGSTLIESSPWAALRLNLAEVDHRVIDFGDYLAEEVFDFVAIDPPWYHPVLTDWVTNAAALCRPGARLVFPLFGEGTRPSAAEERERILRGCSRIGHVDVIRNAVQYEVPRFEAAALAAAGVLVHGPWRVSDLAILTIKRPPENLTALRHDDSWQEIRLGEYLVAVRSIPFLGPSDGDGSLISPIPGVDNWVLDSVSRRDARWESINVWVSDNRVAYSPDTDRLLAALKRLARGTPSTSGTDAQKVHGWLRGNGGASFSFQ